jgi:hypothetical protein
MKLCIAVLVVSILAANGNAQTLQLSHADYLDRVTAIWEAQMIGQATGVRFEHRMSSTMAVTPPSELPGYAPIDDDYYYEMVAVRAFDRYGIHMTVAQLGKQWLENSAGAWGSSREALLLMRRGIVPPLTGNPRYNKLWWTIGPEFSSDLYGALSPGQPLEAARLAREYGHINGYAEGVDGAVFVAGMISIAFAEHNSHEVVEGAASLIAEGSPYREALDSVIAMARAGKQPQEIFATLDHRWGVEYPGTNNAVLNGAIVATGVWFGEGNYQKTLQLMVHAADFADTDCNAANGESVVAAMHGTNALPSAEVAALHDRVKGKTLGPETLTPAVDESISQLGERTAVIGEAMMRDRKVHDDGGIFHISVQKPSAGPLERFRLGDLMQWWNPEWTLLRAGFGGGDGGVYGLPGMTYLDGNILATYPYDQVRGVVLERRVKLIDKSQLTFQAGVDEDRTWRLDVYINDQLVLTEMVDAASATVTDGNRRWLNVSMNLEKYRGQQVVLRICQQVLGSRGRPGDAYWRNIILE